MLWREGESLSSPQPVFYPVVFGIIFTQNHFVLLLEML